MNWDQIKGDWHQLSRRLREKWKELTTEELTSIAGRRDLLEVLLQKRYGYDQQRAGAEVDKFATALTS